jgi:glycosyltransferase involved in cell wall biosynthesis
MSREVAPDVSVLVITYNHERYIGHALDSVFMQQGVDFEVIVSEDRSSDGTLDIIRSRLAGQADARLIASEHNLACNETILRAIRAARGRYVAMLDGDDFWTVADRLARQVALLDAHPRLTVCSHNALLVHGDADVPTQQRWTSASQAPRINLADLCHGNPFATCATMMRRSALASVGDWFAELGRRRGTAMVTDWPLYLTCAQDGDIAFVDEPVGAYRLHDESGFRSLAERKQLDLTAELYRRMDAGLGFRYHHEVLAGAATYFTDWMKEHAARDDKPLARRAAWHALRSGGIGQAFGWGRWLRWAAASVA